MDCLVRLLVGKPVWLDEAGKEIDPQFWVPERVGTHKEQTRLIERFLGHHLGHVLGTVTVDVIIAEQEPWDPNDDPITKLGAADLETQTWPLVEDPAGSNAAQLLRDRLRARMTTGPQPGGDPDT